MTFSSDFDAGFNQRRELLKFATLVPALGALSLFPKKLRAQNNEPLRIGYLPITDATPLLIAHHQGLFEQQGVEVEKPILFRSWAQIVEAFMAGQVNIVHMLAPMTIWARYGSGAKAKIVAWNHTGGSALTVQKTINDIADLGGTTVAIPFWYSIHNVVLQQLLRDHGLEPIAQGEPNAAQTKLVVMAPSDMVPALANRHIAGYIVAEPFNALAEKRGIGKILRFTDDVWKDHACCVVMMSERDLQTRPEWVQNVVTSLAQAQLWIQDNRAETAEILSNKGSNRYTPHDYDVLADVLVADPTQRQAHQEAGAIVHPDWGDKRIDFQPFPYPSYTQKLLEELKSTVVLGQNAFLNELDPSFVVNDLVDDRFVREAIKQLGGPSAFGLPNNLERSEVLETKA